MHLSRLDLRHFRNLGVQEMVFPPEGVAIIGENAQGKSNLLEAIYYLEIFRSYRGARDDQLVAFDEDLFRIVGCVEGEGKEKGGQEIVAAYQRGGKRKKVEVGGVEPGRLGEALGGIAAVIFSPADVVIVSGGPSRRRRFLDIVLSLNVAGYLEALQRFRHALAQRNAALREERPPELVRIWDSALTVSGGRVSHMRRSWIRDWSASFGSHYRIISGGEEVRMDYDPSIRLDGLLAENEVVRRYRETLDSATERERRLGTTVIGPHRDDLRFLMGDRDRAMEVREFGSGGQKRTAALSLRLLEASTIREARKREPTVLMDDVFAELDAGRSRRLMELIEREETGQVILTVPKESDIRIRRDSLPRWNIEGGRVER